MVTIRTPESIDCTPVDPAPYYAQLSPEGRGDPFRACDELIQILGLEAPNNSLKYGPKIKVVEGALTRLGLRKTSSRSELVSDKLKPILSGGEVPEGTSTTGKSVLADRNGSDRDEVLHKPSRLQSDPDSAKYETRDFASLVGIVVGLIQKYPWLSKICIGRTDMDSLTPQCIGNLAANHLFDDHPKLFGITLEEARTMRRVSQEQGYSSIQDAWPNA